MRERPVGTVWLEETNNGVVLHMRVGTGADVMLTLPNAEVAAQAEAQLRSTLAMAALRLSCSVAILAAVRQKFHLFHLFKNPEPALFAFRSALRLFGESELSATPGLALARLAIRCRLVDRFAGLRVPSRVSRQRFSAPGASLPSDGSR